MLELQMNLLRSWWAAGDAIRRRTEMIGRDDRGEVTATTAIIVLLVTAAIAAGAVIAARITSNANSVPSP